MQDAVHDELADVRRALVRPPRDRAHLGLRRAAVAAMISPGRRLWLMRRSVDPDDPWSGHLAFPGGREDPGDATLLDVALRETREEVGVDLTGAELLGRLDDLRARPTRGLVVRPFVFRLDATPRFVTNHEVQSMHSIGLDDLLAGRGRSTMRWPGRRIGVRLPAVDVDGVRLWGLTLAMIDGLLDRIDGRGTGLDRPGYARSGVADDGASG